MLNRLLNLPVATHIIASLGALAAFQGVKSALDASYAASLHPVDYATGQLSFNADLVEGYYSTMASHGTLPIYWRTQFIDFGFLAMVALIALLLGTLVARLSQQGNWGYRFGIAAAALGVCGAMMDAAENVTSFVMLLHPTEIAGFVALIYSSFAAIKFALLTAAMLFLMLSFTLGLIARLRSKLTKSHNHTPSY